MLENLILLIMLCFHLIKMFKMLQNKKSKYKCNQLKLVILQKILENSFSDKIFLDEDKVIFK